MSLGNARDSYVPAGAHSATAHPDASIRIGKRTLVEEVSVQRRTREPGLGPSSEDVQAAAAHGTRGSGGQLPHLATIQQLFGRHDVSHVQAHTDDAAREAATAMNAHAFASRDRVAFAGTPDLHTAAHEAAHVVQQRGGVQLKGGVGEAGDPYERHADAVADAVVAGRSAEQLLDAHAGSSGGGTSVVQRDAKDKSPKEKQAEQRSRVERLIHLLTTTPGVTGPESWDDAYAFLAGLSMPDMLATMSAAADRGYLPQLIARSNSAGAYGRARLLSALYAVELSRASPSSVTNERLNQAGIELDQIPQDQQLQVLEYIIGRKGVNIASMTLMEGVLAMRDQQSARSSQATAAGAPPGSPGHGALGPATAGVAGTAEPPSPIEPGSWAPPGEQPIPLYIGNEAHKNIARNYELAHGSEQVRSNFFPISSILRTFTGLGHAPNTGALDETELGLMPDITNLTRLHLYEIKPVAAQALGAAKATLCVGLFGRAGIAMQLGPTTEPGTTGGLPAPGGVYMFWSPEPGVIVYQYRKGRLVPAPVPEPEPVVVRRWRFELQPMTQQQQQAVTTLTVGGALLLVAMVVLAPVGI